MEGSGRQVYNLYEQLRSRGAVRLELWCGLDGREYFTLSNHPPGPPLPSPPSPVIKRRRRRHRTRRRSSPTFGPGADQQDVDFNGRAAQTLPSNGRGVGALPAKIRDDSELLRNGRDFSRKWRGPPAAPPTASSTPQSRPLSLTEIPQVDGLNPILDNSYDSVPRDKPEHGAEPEPGVELEPGAESASDAGTPGGRGEIQAMVDAPATLGDFKPAETADISQLDGADPDLDTLCDPHSGHVFNAVNCKHESDQCQYRGRVIIPGYGENDLDVLNDYFMKAFENLNY